MSPQLFNVYTDGGLRELKERVVGMGAKIRKEGREWEVSSLFVRG